MKENVLYGGNEEESCQLHQLWLESDEVKFLKKNQPFEEAHNFHLCLHLF
jgi:hypothetical protein